MIKTFTEEETAKFIASIAKKPVSAGMLCYDPKTKKVLVVLANYKTWWSLPGGLCEAGESPLAIAEFVGVERAQYKLENSDRLYFVFASKVSETVELNLQKDEIEKAKWVDASGLRKTSNNKGSLKIAADWLESGRTQFVDNV